MSSAEYSCKFSNLFAYRQTVWTRIRLLLEEQSDLGPHCLQKWLLKSQADDTEEQSDLGLHCLQKLLLKSQADDKADDNCCDW